MQQSTLHFEGTLCSILAMAKKTPKLFFGYSTGLIIFGIIALRYYYSNSVSSIGLLGTALLLLGVVSLAVTCIYTLHIRGQTQLKRLSIGSFSSLFTGLALLRLNYYINSHTMSGSGWNKPLEVVGSALFLTGLCLLVVIIVRAIVRLAGGNPRDFS